MKKNPKVLVIEDDPAICKLLQALLRLRGCEILTAADGREGLARVGAGDVDLVITDVLMPNLDGIETLIALKRIQPTLPIVVMSGGFELEPEYYLHIAKKLGADRTLLKPFGPTDLFLVLQGLIP